MEPYSTATVLLQWAIALVLLFLANGWMVRRLAATDPASGETPSDSAPPEAIADSTSGDAFRTP